MTPGYDPQSGPQAGPPTAAPEQTGTGPRHSADDEPATRAAPPTGPLPPRMRSTWGAPAGPAQPAAIPPPAPRPEPSPLPAPSPSGPGGPGPGGPGPGGPGPGGPGPEAHPGGPAQPQRATPPGKPVSPYPPSPFVTSPFAPQSAPPAFGGLLTTPTPAPTSAPAPAPAPAAPQRGGWPGVVALVLVLLLVGVVGFQAYQIDRLSDRLGATDQRLAEAQAVDETRIAGLEGRAGVLEEQAGNVFNPEGISSAVLPSVFRVRAGDFTGTAFAVGAPSADGGTNLFTNYHVVESVWDGGGRQVFLERTDQRFLATIVKVDKRNDVAQLRTERKFDGLAAAAAEVRSGQQIVVVGAPLGLADTVTTGVVSTASRNLDDGSGSRIQFDAPINPGNSGGPVVNGSKEVVGIATAKARDAEGIGLAVPIKIACGEFKIC